MDLHRTGKRSDWSMIPPGKQNKWQRTASRTHGIITPGNAVSLLGALLVVLGLFYLYEGNLGVGLFYLFIGRLADVADGIVAARTRTKSPLGEAVDAIIDKLTLLAAVTVFWATGVVPWIVILLIALLNGVNAVMGLIAKIRRHRIHPSLIGKLAAVFQWVAILMYIAAAVQYENTSSFAGTTITVFATSSLIVSLVLGLATAGGYAFTAFGSRSYVREL